MCEVMAQHDPGLVSIRNKSGEMPLFLAAKQGNKDSFLCLHSICGFKRGQTCCTRPEDGTNILHCAIIVENFGEYISLIGRLMIFFMIFNW